MMRSWIGLAACLGLLGGTVTASSAEAGSIELAAVGFGSGGPTEKENMLAAVMTANTAIKFCGYGGKEKVDAVAEVYGVQPSRTDISVIKPIIERLTDEVGRGKDAFCKRAWDLYGETGSQFAGLLSRSKDMPSPAAEWDVRPIKEEGKFSHCIAMRASDQGVDQIWGLPDSVAFVLVRPGVTVDPAKGLTLEIGGDEFDLTGGEDEPEQDSITFPVKDAIADALSRSDAFTVRVSGKSFRVPFGEGKQVLAKVRDCVASSRGRS